MTEDNSWPSARFGVALEDEARLWDEVRQELLSGKTLRVIGRERGYPVTRFCQWVGEDAKRREEFEGILKVAALLHVSEVVEIADAQREVEREDGSKYDPNIARDTLRVKTRLQAAEKLDPGRWAPRTQVQTDMSITVRVVRGVTDLPVLPLESQAGGAEGVGHA